MTSLTSGRVVDLNADLGESFGRWRLGDDAAMLRVVTSANIACGFHAGDPTTLVETCRGAVEHGVAIGAQVGYRDLAGFGRRRMDIAPADLYADVLYQLSALDGIARTVGGRVGYVKPHGALYTTVGRDELQAEAVVRAVADHSPGAPVLGLPGSALLVCAERAGLHPVAEAFADRAYRPDGTLLPRSEAGAVLHDPVAVAARVARLVAEGRVAAEDGTDVEVDAASVCVHGDSPGAVEMALAVRAALEAAGVTLAAFSGATETQRQPSPPDMSGMPRP